MEGSIHDWNIAMSGIRQIVGWVFGLLVFVIMVCWMIISTPYGTSLLMNGMLNDHWVIKEGDIKGSLVDGVDLHAVQYKDRGISLLYKDVSLSWPKQSFWLGLWYQSFDLTAKESVQNLAGLEYPDNRLWL